MRPPFSHCLAHQPLTALLADTHHFIQDGLDWMMMAIMIIHENYHLMMILYGLAICYQSYRPAIGGICLEMEAFALKFFVPSAPPPPLAVVNYWLKMPLSLSIGDSCREKNFPLLI